MSKDYYEIHLRLDKEMKEKIEGKMLILGYQSVNAYISELITNDVNNKGSELETIMSQLSELKKNQVDVSYYQAFMTFCIELLLASNGNYVQVEYALNEIDKLFAKSRYRETAGLEKLSELTNTTRALFTQNTRKDS